MKLTPKLSIVIVNYNTKDLLFGCLTSLAAAAGQKARWEVFVVDNGSTDGSREFLRRYKRMRRPFGKFEVILNRKNNGFAKANNTAIRQARGEYLLLLNSDTEVEPATIRHMVKFMDKNRRVGAATCKLVLPSGSLDPACHRGFPTPWAAMTYFAGLERVFPRSKLFAQYHQGYKDITTIHDVDCVSGAFFLVRRAVVTAVGELDEEYFMYAEDIDWAYRMRAAGWRIVFNPEVSVLHRKKQSGRAHADQTLRKETERHFYETMRLFYRKHYRTKYSFLVFWFIECILTVRIVMVRIFSL